MEDALLSLLTNYGDDALTWVLALLALAASWTMRRIGASKEVLDVLRSIGIKARDVVMEVYQTYVEALKEGRKDGILTDEEKREALRRAKAKLLERLTWREAALLAGGVLTRLLGKSSWADKLERLVEGQIETAIAENKFAARAAAGPKLELVEGLAEPLRKLDPEVPR
jgi:hypothetical protein